MKVIITTKYENFDRNEVIHLIRELVENPLFPLTDKQAQKLLETGEMETKSTNPENKRSTATTNIYVVENETEN